VDFIDTWTVVGLQGTGSTDFEARDVFVPEARSILEFGRRSGRESIFRFPAFGMLAIGIGATALGAARAALSDLVSLAGAKTPDGSRRRLAERATTQNDVGRAEAALRSARAFFYEAIDAAWMAAVDGEVSVRHRSDVRLATTHAVAAAKTAVDLVYDLAGGSAVYRSSPIQRRFRDIHVATQHMMVSQGTYELVGRLLLGLDTNTDQL